eukprot:GILK01003757.1.p1 GENE.GILK01003757.1~~GILK01003757.1.p1  ORF type:complete len:615 (+),score=65.01 GILK01003757.1:73-1917(+)
MQTSPALSDREQTAMKVKMQDQLTRLLERRPSKAELMQQNIIKQASLAPSLQATQQRLLKKKGKDVLSRSLQNRRTHDELRDQNIIKTPTSSSLQHVSAGQHLAEFLNRRPTVDQLRQLNVLKETLVWSRETCSTPSARNCHTMSLVADNLFLIGGFGGRGFGGNKWFNDLLLFNTARMTWSRPVISSSALSERYAHTTSLVGSKLFVFGGFGEGEGGRWLNDLYVLDIQDPKKSQRTKGHSVPIPPSYASVTAVPNETSPSSSTASSPGSVHPVRLPTFPSDSASTSLTGPVLSWSKPVTQGKAPPPRAAHTCTVVGSHLWFFGGNDGSQFFNDVHVLDTETLTWLQPIPEGAAPNVRAGHTATAVKRDMYIFGGGDVKQLFNDLWILHTDTRRWREAKISGTPPTPRAGHSTVAVNGKLFVFGGGDSSRVLNDLHLFDTASLTWSRPSDTGVVPAPRAGHTATLVGSRIFFFGGGDVDGRVFSDLHVLDLCLMASVFQNAPRGIESPRVSSVETPKFSEPFHKNSLDLDDAEEDVTFELLREIKDAAALQHKSFQRDLAEIRQSLDGLEQIRRLEYDSLMEKLIMLETHIQLNPSQLRRKHSKQLRTPSIGS